MRSTAAEVSEQLRQAQAAFRAGRLAEAEMRATSALRLAPENADALTLRALAQQSLGRHVEAIESFSKLTEWQPAVASHWINLGTVYRADKRLDAALAAYQRAAELGERSANFYYNVGLLQLDRCQLIAADAALLRARELAPRDAEICYFYAHCCHARMDNEQALAALIEWETLDGLSGELTAKFALLLTKLGEVRRAQQAIELVPTLAMHEPKTALTLLQVHERINQLSQANALLEKLRKDSSAAELLANDLVAAEGLLAQRRGDHASARKLLATAAAACDEPHMRHYQLFRLAKSLDALGEFAAAFTALEAAHESQAALLKLTAPTAVARTSMRVAQYGCVAADVAQWDNRGAPPSALSPIFIVGFPRSGTTLLEQALDAHPALQSMDEQPFMQKILDRLTESGVGYAHTLRSMTPSQLTAAREHYWRLARGKVELRPGQRLVDKNPLNMMALPLIQRLFPHSRILLALRHPCDVLLSCHMQHFGAPEFALLCGNLHDLAIGYNDAFSFWYEEAAVLQPTVRELRYEDVVSDFVGEARQTLEFLELPWDDAVLRPAEHARAKGFISTPSYSQVIQPISSSSVGRWQNYAAHFQGAMPLLAPWLRRWGYPVGDQVLVGTV